MFGYWKTSLLEKQLIIPTLFANKLIFNDLERESNLLDGLKLFHVLNLCILEIFHVLYLFSKNVDIIEFATVEETVTSTMEALLRMVALCVYKKRYTQLYKTMTSKFWPSNAFGSTIESKTTKFSKIVNMFSHLNTFSAFVTMGVLLSLPKIHGTREFPFKIWLPSWMGIDPYVSPCFEIICVWQWITNYWTVLFSILCYDYIYVMFAVSVLNQLKMLNIAFRSVGKQNSNPVVRFLLTKCSGSGEKREFEIMKVCIEHHSVLLRFINEMYNTYSLAFLAQFAGTFNALCFSGYILATVKIDDPVTFLHILTYIFVHLIEIFILLNVATEIHSENLSISDAAFDSGWQKHNSLSFNKQIVLIIQSAQNSRHFTAGGFVDCNLAGLLMIIKWSFSVITLLQKVE